MRVNKNAGEHLSWHRGCWNITAVSFCNTLVDVFAQSGICQSLKPCAAPFEQVARDKFQHIVTWQLGRLLWAGSALWAYVWAGVLRALPDTLLCKYWPANNYWTSILNHGFLLFFPPLLKGDSSSGKHWGYRKSLWLAWRHFCTE